MKKIIASLAMIAAAGGIATGGTFALFSDTESSAGNTFTAGTLNLTLNGNDGVAVTPLFSFTNVTPDTTGFSDIELENTGSVAGSSIGTTISNVTYSGSCTEPEVNDDLGDDDDCTTVGHIEDVAFGDTPGVGQSKNELAPNVTVTFTDLGADGLPGGSGANQDTVLATNTLENILAGVTVPGGIAAGGSKVIRVSWSVGAGVGNEIQNDGVSFSFNFTLNQ